MEVGKNIHDGHHANGSNGMAISRHTSKKLHLRILNISHIFRGARKQRQFFAAEERKRKRNGVDGTGSVNRARGRKSEEKRKCATWPSDQEYAKKENKNAFITGAMQLDRAKMRPRAMGVVAEKKSHQIKKSAKRKRNRAPIGISGDKHSVGCVGICNRYTLENTICALVRRNRLKTTCRY